ncbi:sn-glycerol 3-phosphate transport system permease protein [Stella humosa]|uniref:sn-glycerol-3-phosphate transport system permease protein UgpE n=1 Tax=Stella humosa TaxID=94 RepID=A0A3N1KRN5_9PROT|nr:sn-glycerol-3-phosphate ABC transporter permease UgpE [Stella humosa]ROP84553.1 sn-glycerol 3-phosphate transport system permease protein [Stella humosa]BBK34073.1 sn-glycerol-3-phosphate transport system permease protein UgpE [Stella humosa]
MKHPRAERIRTALFRHGVLLVGLFIVAFPIWVAFVGSTLTSRDIRAVPMPLLPGSHGLETYWSVLTEGGGALSRKTPVAAMMWNSLVMAVCVAVGKIVISILSAFAIVYFRFPGRMLFFWLVFVTLMLPAEVRILPTFQVVADLGMLDSYAGLIVPLLASATATFLFRQFFLTVPKELAEAARIDGAGPLRFLWSVLLPLSATNIAALFVVLFIYGWNQYLWPLLVTKELETIVVGVYRLLAVGDDSIDWPVVMATAILAMTPPILVVVAMQRWFVKGLVDVEK